MGEKWNISCKSVETLYIEVYGDCTHASLWRFLMHGSLWEWNKKILEHGQIWLYRKTNRRAYVWHRPMSLYKVWKKSDQACLIYLCGRTDGRNPIYKSLRTSSMGTKKQSDDLSLGMNHLLSRGELDEFWKKRWLPKGTIKNFVMKSDFKRNLLPIPPPPQPQKSLQNVLKWV